MDESLRREVRQRAKHACEYCRLPQRVIDLTFEVDHVIARKHGGKTMSSNLALSCPYCNQAKGSNIAGLDPKTGRVTPLFHPRRHKWSRHFRWTGPVLEGRTPVGRATVAVLGMNNTAITDLRLSLIAEGVFPLRERKRRTR